MCKVFYTPSPRISEQHFDELGFDIYIPYIRPCLRWSICHLEHSRHFWVSSVTAQVSVTCMRMSSSSHKLWLLMLLMRVDCRVSCSQEHGRIASRSSKPGNWIYSVCLNLTKFTGCGLHVSGLINIHHYKPEEAVREAATICPDPASWPFDLESGVRVMWRGLPLCQF